MNLFVFLPRIILYPVARTLGFAAFYIVGRERRKVLRNLRFAYGELKSAREYRIIACKVFQNMALTAVDFILFKRLNLDKIKRFTKFHGFENLEAGFKESGKGVIVLSAHIGNWELLAGSVIAHGYEGTVMAKEIYYAPYNKIIVDLRNRFNVKTVFRHNSPRELFRMLKRKAIAGLVPDQDLEDIDGVYVEYFGMPAYTPLGPAKIALTTKVPIIPAFAIRDGRRYDVIIEKPISASIKDGETKDQALKRITQEWNDVVEKYVKKYPDQWAWMHNRWKTAIKNNMIEREY